MPHENVMNGADDLAKGHPATQSAKAAFRKLIPDLPENWKQLMYVRLPSLNTPSGATRLTKIRQGKVAPTKDEIEAVEGIIADNKPSSKDVSSQIRRQRIKSLKALNKPQ